MLVSLLLSRLCPMSRICPFYVLIMSHICPCPLYDLNLSSKSNLCPHQIPFLSSWSNFCPLFVIYLWHISLKYWRTKTSQNLDLTFFLLLSGHTAAGQILDNLWIHGSPKIVNYLSKSHNSFQMHVYHSICGLVKYWTNTGTPILTMFCLWPR